MLDRPAVAALEAADPGLGARPGSWIVVEVADTGTGIPPDVLARIWEPFFTTKGENQGTGLGLSTVRGIALRHGGWVTVDTKVGHGTTFRVFLPAAEGAGSESPYPTAPDAARGAGELILVVDDAAAVRDTIVAILTRHGYHTVCAADGVEAIGLFIQHLAQIRLVVSDINMPNLDGPALALVLKRLQPAVKILAMTGLDSAGIGGTRPATSVTAFAAARLQKPFTVEALLVAVHHVLHPDAGVE